jgi:hypothetical protein
VPIAVCQRAGPRCAGEKSRWGVIAVGDHILAVNSRTYDSDALKQAIKTEAGNGRPVELLIKSGDLYRTVSLDCTAGFAIHGWRRSEKGRGRSTLLAPR